MVCFAGVLCGCTTTGNVVFWKHSGGDWDPLPPAKVQGVAKSCTWGGAMLAVNSSTATYIMKEHNLCAAYHQGVRFLKLKHNYLQKSLAYSISIKILVRNNSFFNLS